MDEVIMDEEVTELTEEMLEELSNGKEDGEDE